MSQCDHNHGHGSANQGMLAHGRSGAEGRSLLAALAVISVFMVVEFVGGILSGSLALIADASHMMTDAVALALAASAQWLSMKPADGRLHFGYRRFQVLAAFVNGIALVLLMAWIVWEAIQRSITPIAVSWQPMLVIAGIGLVANVVVFRMLHGSAAHNINVRGAMLHVIGDLLGSIAAVAAALVIAISGWTRIDPLLSMVVALLIGYSAYRLLRETAHILLEGAPAGIDANEVAVELASLSPDIEDVHGVQLWQITPEYPLATMHVRIRNPASAQETLALIKARLAERYGIRESTIQIETGCCYQDLHAPPSEHERGDNSEPDHAAIRPSRVGNLRVV